MTAPSPGLPPEVTRPTDCGRCMAEFFRDSVLQAKALHTARTEGEAVAESVVNEAMESIHASHSSDDSEVRDA